MKKLIFCTIAFCILLGCTAKQIKSNDDKNDRPPPKLLAPNVKKIWIPPQMKEGGLEWEEGHYLYRIERGVSWSR